MRSLKKRPVVLVSFRIINELFYVDSVFMRKNERKMRELSFRFFLQLNVKVDSLT